MKLLSFDQATNKIGWSLFDNDNLIDYGTNDFSGIKDAEEKILQIKIWINQLIIEKKAEIFAIEDIQFEKNKLVFKKLAELLGVIKNSFYEQEFCYFVVENSKWRSVCGIKGRKREEQKANTQKFVLNKYNIEVSEDTADAICIGYYVIKKILKGYKNEK